MTAASTLAHSNMVNNQIRGWDVVDKRVLDTLANLPRERFAPEAWRSMAYADMPLPLGDGQCMLPPVVEGRMLQALELKPDDTVLEIGTGSGFITACLSRMSAHVTSIDIRESFTQAAGGRLRELDCDNNVTLVTGEAVHEWHPDRHFDAIAVTGAVARIPERWHDWLRPGGRLFVIHGQLPIMQASVLHASGVGIVGRESIFDTRAPYLEHAGPAPDYTA